MVTKRLVTKEIKLTLKTCGGERNSFWKLPEFAFLLNYSSSEREIMNEEGGIYRESFHLNLDW